MKKSVFVVSVAVFAIILSVLFTKNAQQYVNQVAEETKNNDIQTKQIASENYGNLPLHFEPNQGQTDEQVKFLARGNGYGLFLTANEAVLSLEKRGEEKQGNQRAVVKMRFEGAHASSETIGLNKTESKSNYFIGSNPKNWQTGISNFEKVKYESIYDGIDLVFYGNGKQLEYDFIVASGVNPNQIKIKFDGIKNVGIEKATGDLLLETEAGTIRQHKPFVYQEIEGERKEVASSYTIQDSEIENPTVSFNLGKYDESKELVIDPILAYGSYLGGNFYDEGRSIAIDAQGNAYIVGTAASRDFPATDGTIKPQMLPRTGTTNSFWYDAFVTKVNPTGTAIVFSTYFGGRDNNESGQGVAIDASGNVYLSGTTMSGDLPLVNAYQTTFGGTDDGFAAKLNSNGSAIIYSTYLGGNNTDIGGKIAVHQASGEATFTGLAYSPDFPTTPGALKQKLCATPVNCSGIFYTGSYVARFSANGNVQYATLFDAGINDVTLDGNNNAVVGGTASAPLFVATPGAFQTVSSGGIDGFIAKLNPSGNAIVYGTFLGGGLQSDRVKSIALDAAQNIYVTGQTENFGFPVTANAFDQTFNGFEDGFVTKLNAEGSALVYSTFLGGIGKDQPFGIALNETGDAFITGETTNALSFPLKNSLLGTSGTIFLTRLNSEGSTLVFSTLLGFGGGYDLAVDGASNAYVTGSTTGILVTPDAFQTVRNNNISNISDKDGFVVKISPANENQTFYSISGTVTDANYGYNNDHKPIVVTISGAVNRSFNLPYSGGQFVFGSLPAGGNYTITAQKVGYVTDPQSISFNNLGANQFADFTILRKDRPFATITSPQHGAVFNVSQPINIQANATAQNGNAIQSVEFVAYSSETGNVNLGTDTTEPYEFTWANAPRGTWALHAFPTDNQGLRGDSVSITHITVVDPNGASVVINSPVAGQTFTEGETVPIGVSVSSSVNLVEVRDENNNLVGRMTASPWTAQWRAMEVGNHTLTAKAFTSTGQTATSAPVNITVNRINHRISGRIVDSITGNGVGGISVNLRGNNNQNIFATATTDNNGNYHFTDLGTTPIDGVTITPSSNSYNFSPENKNIVYLGYVEWTNQNFTATQKTQIAVTMTSPTGGQTFSSTDPVNLAANASSSAGSITKVEFFRRNTNGTNTLIAADTVTPFAHSWTNAAPGIYSLFARATDSTGAVAETGTVEITVSVPAVRLEGKIVDTGGEPIGGVTVYVGGGLADTVTTDAFGRFAFTNLPSGRNYTITPLPTTVTYTPVSRSYTNVTANISGIDFVGAESSRPPTVQINSPANGATFTMPAEIPVNVTANDPDGRISLLRVTATGGGTGRTIGQVADGTFDILWQPTVPGEYEIYAEAIDNVGNRVITKVNIKVNPPPPVSISGRIVDRNSIGIEDVELELTKYGDEETVIATAVTDAGGNYTVQNVTTFGHYVLRAEKLNYTFSPQQRVFLNLAASQTAADFTGTLQVQTSDFDGDSESDLAVWRPSTGVWYVRRSTDKTYAAQQFGGESFGDVAVPGNYDGDQKIDYAVFRKGNWYIHQSSNGQVRGIQFGVSTDKAVPGDYDGDGKTDVAVWRPDDGVWYILRSMDGKYDFRQFGTAGDIPLSGDFDGDGVTDLTVWRPSTGAWYVLKSSDGGFLAFQFGTEGDVPLVGDFDGDRRADFTVFRLSTGEWHIWQSSTNSYKGFQWGNSTDMPVPGDYDRDGKTDYAVFRKAEGNWYIFKSSTGNYAVQNFGASGDMPIPAAFNK